MNRVILCMLAGLSALLSSPLAAQVVPTALQHDSLSLNDVAQVTLPGIDLAAVTQEDLVRESTGLPPRFAIPNTVKITPASDGTLEVLDDGRILWRLRISAPGAANLNLGFTTYNMPEGGQLLFYSADAKKVVRPFTHEDNASHGELWTPVMATDDAVVEVTIPRELFGNLALELTQIGYGYRGFGSKAAGPAKSGSCNVDVVCSAGDDWRSEIPAIAVIALGGSTFCTGFMVNNTANDRTPYFMTANHCGIGSGNAASLVTYWNYETSVCNGSPNGQLNQFNTGAFFRSSYSPSDFTLVELDSDPNPAFEITFAGWDRSGANSPGAIAIHQPSTDEKAISFENQPTSVTSYLGNSVPGDGTHVKVTDWDIGTTEPGSSGSPLFNTSHQVIGQLHGGFAACGNNDADWYGAFAVSWTGGGSSSSRLRDWLDPANTGAMSVPTLGGGLSVSPSTAVLHEGPVGGPFTNSSVIYTLLNNGDSAVNYRVTVSSPTNSLLINGGTSQINGNLPATGGASQFTASLAASVSSLGGGLYTAEITIEDLTNGIATTRSHTLEIGRTTVASIPMNTNPGWSTNGRWRFGTPSGGGGSSGNPDPTSGATGNQVFGYDLAGDYTDNLSEQHLTSTPFDFTGMSGVKVSFQRWLNVEVSTWDHAYFRASNDGVNFVTIWENNEELTDSAWSKQEFDISDIADDESTVYLRWTMGTTDGSLVYSGWNIDDVEITAIAPSSFTNYGVGLAGSGGFTPSIAGAGDTSIGGNFTVDIEGGLGGAFGAAALGFQRANLPFYGGNLLVDPPLSLVFLTLSGPSGVPGVGTFGATTSITDPGMAGVVFQLQGIFVDAGATEGYSLSQGLEVTAGL
jgi:lysyl endopeptidase